MDMTISPRTFKIIQQNSTKSIQKNWDNGQFADADTSTDKSERIRREYTQHLLDLSDNQYYYEENPINQLQYSSLDPDYYWTPTRGLQNKPHDPNSYYPPPPDPADVQHWQACGRGKGALLHGHRLFGKKDLIS